MSPRSAPWCAARSSGARSEPRGQTPAHFGAWIGAGLRPVSRDRRTHSRGGSGVVGRRGGRDGSQPTLHRRRRPQAHHLEVRQLRPGEQLRQGAALRGVLAHRIDEERVPAPERRPPRLDGCRSRAPGALGSSARSAPTAAAGTHAAAGRATRRCRRAPGRASRACAGSRSRSPSRPPPMKASMAARSSSSGVSVQPGPCTSASVSRCATPRRAASAAPSGRLARPADPLDRHASHEPSRLPLWVDSACSWPLPPIWTRSHPSATR